MTPKDYADDGEEIEMHGQHIREIHHHHGRENWNGNGNGFSKLRDALLPIAIAALVAVVWNLSINVAKMQTKVDALADQIVLLRTK